MQNRIAIVIPAYKGKFLSQTLDSIAAQDCRSFTLYIGDDCSPDDIGGITDRYRDCIDIRYMRFNENKGKTDLLSHWDRCIEMVDGEPYIHFFSDDDIMPHDAVRRALEYIKKYPRHSFFRFSLATIGPDSAVLHTNPEFSSEISSAEELLCDKLGCRRTSAAIEYVFSRALYEKTGGFVKFPAAWCSDDATWYLMAKKDGIVNIPGDPVSWRNAAGCNISNNSRFNTEKAQATALFLKWLHQNYSAERNRMFRNDIQTYVNTILNTSLESSYSLSDLLGICKAEYRLDGCHAIKTFLKNIKTRKQR